MGGLRSWLRACACVAGAAVLGSALPGAVAQAPTPASADAADRCTKNLCTDVGGTVAKPICARDREGGGIVQFASSCHAACHSYTIVDRVDCPRVAQEDYAACVRRQCRLEAGADQSFCYHYKGTTSVVSLPSSCHAFCAQVKLDRRVPCTTTAPPAPATAERASTTPPRTTCNGAHSP